MLHNSSVHHLATQQRFVSTNLHLLQSARLIISPRFVHTRAVTQIPLRFGISVHDLTTHRTRSLLNQFQPREFRTSAIMSTSTSKDWSASQYLKFSNERTRPVHDLISQIVPVVSNPTPRIYDLGCGPGNSTQALLSTFPDAIATGVDSSPDMLKKARATLPDTEFVQADISTFEPAAGKVPDMLFSNAMFHWLRSDTRIPTIVRLFQALRKGGVLAFQVPDNYHAPTHSLMRTVALQASQPWSKYFADAHVGDLSYKTRPDLDPVESSHAFYNALIPHAASVNVWRTEYQHVVSDAKAIVEWVRGTGLMPFLERLEGDEDAKDAFLKAYEEALKNSHPGLEDGKVLLGYPRLFLVAVRK